MEQRVRRRGESGRPLRVAVGGIFHETNTFSPAPTTLADFRRRAYLVGDAIAQQSRGARHVLGGIVDAAEGARIALVPTLFAAAMPGGMVARETWSHLRTRLIDRLWTQHVGPWKLDGVVLVLHGAMVAEDEDDPEGTLLRDVRTVVGWDVPVVATVDFHANVSAAMTAAADVLVGYRAYPHVDAYACGEEAIARLINLRSDRWRPTTALRVLPLLTPLPPQATIGATPMAEVAARGRDLARQARFGAVDITVAGGFPYADVPGAGVSVRVTTDDDAPLADGLADRMAAALWDRRERFQATGLPPAEAIERAEESAIPGRPVVLADTGDNPGAGATGDGTALLAPLLARRTRGAAVATIADPAAVAVAWAAGAGATVRVSLGGHWPGNEPLAVTATVAALTDGTFVNGGPMGSGGATRMGRTAVLLVDGVEVVVSERRVAAIDPALFRSVGIEPTARRVLAVKSSVHFRAAFEPLAAAVVEALTPGLSGSDLGALPYRRVRRPVFPLDREVPYLD